jgi:g-D-glutamyl-meso-diaminopimelate peptidase
MKKDNVLIKILAVVATVLVAATVISAVFFVRNRFTADPSEKETALLPEDEEETPESEAEEQTEEEEASEETSEEEHKKDKFEYLVCVPADYMTLRSTPGLGNDGITQLRAGTYLKWYGEVETVEDADFYYVETLEDGLEGYVAAAYCVDVDFMYDESDLGIVQTTSAMYTYEDMVRDLNTLSSRYPDILQLEVLGTTPDSRDIYAVTFGNPNANYHVMMQSTIHGREYMNTQLVMKLLEYYCYYYEEGSYDKISYKDLFDNTALHIIPMANPDGVAISQKGVAGLNNSYYEEVLYGCYENDRMNMCRELDTNGDPLWVDHYKDENFDLATSQNPQMISFEEYLSNWKANVWGVDLNNNFDAGWEDIDLKAWPSYGSFKGDYPESEIETRLLVDYATRYDYVFYISYHSRGQLIYYDVQGNTGSNSSASTRFADILKDHIKYEPVNTQDAYNVNLGGFGDWIQLGLHKPSVTIESGKSPCPLPIEEFGGIWNRHRESWAMLADQLY